MKKQSLTGRAVLLAIVLAGTAVACSANVPAQGAASNPASNPAASSQTSKGSTVPVARLKKAIAATKSVTSGQFVDDFEADSRSNFSVGTDSGSEPTTTVKNDFMAKHRSPGSPDTGAKGVFDRDHGRARIDSKGSGIPAIVVDGDHYYLKMQEPQDPATPWQEMSADAYNSMGPGLLNLDLTNPMGILQNVYFVGPTAVVVGTDRLNGTPTVHYEAHMNLSALNAARRKPNSSSKMTIVKIVSPKADDIPVDLWVDKSGRVVRIWFAASYDETTTFRTPSDPAHAKTSTSHIDVADDLSLTHPGEPVSISVPPANQVAPPTTGGVMPGSPGH